MLNTWPATLSLLILKVPAYFKLDLAYRSSTWTLHSAAALFPN